MMLFVNLALILALLGVSTAIVACAVERRVLVDHGDGGPSAMNLDRVVWSVAAGGLLLIAAGGVLGLG